MYHRMIRNHLDLRHHRFCPDPDLNRKSRKRICDKRKRSGKLNNTWRSGNGTRPWTPDRWTRGWRFTWTRIGQSQLSVVRHYRCYCCCCCQLLSVVVSCCQLLSVVVSCCQLLSVVVLCISEAKRVDRSQKCLFIWVIKKMFLTTFFS